MNKLYPPIEPFNEFYLNVSDVHTIFVEESGNPKGKPVIFLHGGPGGGIEPIYRQYFNPKKWRIIIFDQRGCGRSKPYASVENNTTWHLVSDMEALRKKLRINKVVLFGGSWGAALSLIYAQTFPEMVSKIILRGVFTMTQSELDWFYKEGGASMFWPEAWRAFRGRSSRH